LNGFGAPSKAGLSVVTRVTQYLLTFPILGEHRVSVKVGNVLS
jgi:flagellar biosynthesis protein FliR